MRRGARDFILCVAYFYLLSHSLITPTSFRTARHTDPRMNQLKEAERQATQMVQNERKARTERLKEAKTAADQNIREFRAQMESEYQAKQSKLTASTGSSGSALQSTTSNEIASLTRDFNSKKDGIVDGIVELVCRVNIKAPKTR